MGDITKNFNRADFQCHGEECADKPNRPITNDAVIAAVQRLRDRLGMAISVSRGLSCQAHNLAIGGAPDSRHLPEHADAVDIRAENSVFAAMIVEAALADPEWKAFRVYEHHVHLDARPGPRRFIASPE